MALTDIKINLQFQPYIPGPPRKEGEMYAQACSNDKLTVDSWRETWRNNIKLTHEKFGSFKDNGCQDLVAKYKYHPVIIAGSGSSLKRNAHLLKNRGDIPLISCLHNYGYFKEIGVEADYYLSLDAGKITLPEMTEGGDPLKKNDYLEATKDSKLLAYIGSDPELWEMWKGKVHLFNCAVSDPAVMELTSEITQPNGEKQEPVLEKFGGYISSGGNALGACMYFAKAVCGGNPIIFVGADFAFGWEHKFHAWDSQYDKMSQSGVMYWPDIFGIKVPTWASYFNFKTWFEAVATYRAPGFYINATEGGIFGSYPEGNIQQVQQMTLEDVLARLNHFQKHQPGFDLNVPEGFAQPEAGLKLCLY